MEDTVADRDPEAIKREIDVARDQLALTVDSLAERANPRRLADDVKARALAVVRKHAVPAAAAGAGLLVLALVVRRIRNR